MRNILGYKLSNPFISFDYETRKRQYVAHCFYGLNLCSYKHQGHCKQM